MAIEHHKGSTCAGAERVLQAAEDSVEVSATVESAVGTATANVKTVGYYLAA